jgi:hypothetical protein
MPVSLFSAAAERSRGGFPGVFPIGSRFALELPAEEE